VSSFFKESLGYDSQGYDSAEVGEDVAVLSVEGDVAAVSVLGGQRSKGVARDALGDAAQRVDGGGDSGIGVAEDPAAVFYSAHAGHVEVLPGGAGVSVPAVVGDVD